MRALRRASIKDLLWNFAVAEFESAPTKQRHSVPEISHSLLARVLRSERSTFTQADWLELLDAVWSTRADIVGPASAQIQDWYVAELDEGDWTEIRVLNLQIFAPLTPPLRLSEFAKSLDSGVYPSTWDPEMYSMRRAAFDLSRMHGLPILVCEQLCGPYSIIEGTCRLSILESKRTSGELLHPTLEVLVGVGSPLDYPVGE